jgi:ketosteroid isomerase-like protein
MRTNDPEVTREIRAREAEFSTLFNSGQLDELLETFYTEDVAFLPPNAPLVRGREGVRGLFVQMAQLYSDVSLESSHVFSDGDMTVVQGAYRAKVNTPEGQTMEDRGKYIEVFRRAPDGTWRCFLDTFTSDLEHPH